LKCGFGYRLFCRKLKIKNNKKIIFGLLFSPKTLFICLFALFMNSAIGDGLKKKTAKTRLRENTEAIQTLLKCPRGESSR